MAVDQRNFGNVLDINGTEVNVEDKRLAELAGQTPKSSSQISTSSQYVPLQDTDGNIVKISPASFQEAVRNTLASLLVNNDKGTSFSQVPVIGSGDFGSASLANLASVLGAWNVEKTKINYNGSAAGYVKIPMPYIHGVGLFAVNAGGLNYDLYYMSSRLASEDDHSTSRVPSIKRLAGDSAKGGTVGFWYSPSEQSLYYSQMYGGALAIMVYLLQPYAISVVSSIPSDNIAVSYTT